jgi:hypothetical protein
MPRTWTYSSPDSIGQPKRPVTRTPSTAREYRPELVLRAQFAAACRPKRSGGSGRRKKAKPRYRPRPRFARPKR